MIFKTSYFILFLSLIAIFSSCNKKKFDSNKWKNWKETESTLFERHEMVEDLIDNHILKGQSYDQVISLLGSTNSETTDSTKLTYNLGPCKTGIDYGVLTISFKNKEVIEIDNHYH